MRLTAPNRPPTAPKLPLAKPCPLSMPAGDQCPDSTPASEEEEEDLACALSACDVRVSDVRGSGWFSTTSTDCSGVPS
jgi:hypothetical protein